MLALVQFAVVVVPQLRPLVARVPLSRGIAERINPLLGARFFFIAPGAAKCRIETTLCQRIQQRARLQQAAAFLRSQRKRSSAVIKRLLIFMHN